MVKIKNALTVILILIIIGLVSAIVYLSVIPQPGERFTEFYLLSLQGKASGYPDKVTAGQPVSLIVGIVNHEGKPVTYTVQVELAGAIIKTMRTEILQDKQKWENRTDFGLDKVGNKQRVEFYLYTENETVPHIKDPLVLLIDVTNTK
jgi:uncharacterized membrane protein